MFISIFMATCRSEKIIAFLDALQATAADPHSYEVLIKLDEGDAVTLAALQHYCARSTASIKYLILPKLKGYYSLNKGYNHLFEIADPRTYFCVLLTDEIRFRTVGWDSIIKSYINYYPDHVFKLEISANRARNYYTVGECLFRPDNYPVLTKRWLSLIGGWGDFWGPDTWLGLINFYLGRGSHRDAREQKFFRSLPEYDIEIMGGEAAIGESATALERRDKMIKAAFEILRSPRAQENFLRLANRLRAHIVAHEHGLTEYRLIENHFSKKSVIEKLDNNIRISNFSFNLASKKLYLYAKQLLGASHKNTYEIKKETLIHHMLPSDAKFISKRLNRLT